jgi:hypothetical protein
MPDGTHAVSSRSTYPLSTGSVHNGWAIAIAWPETWCKRAGAWYDGVMRLLAVNRNGYYQVGHAAVVVMGRDKDEAHYYDMGRYHAPGGTARVRSAHTDHELVLRTRLLWDAGAQLPLNLPVLLNELATNKACHGDGPMHWSVVPVICEGVHHQAKAMQEQDFITYGPFVVGGSNCSRFVNTALRAGRPPMGARLSLRFPWTLSPTPLSNVQACCGYAAQGIVDPRGTPELSPVFA